MRTAVGSPLNCQLCHRRRLPQISFFHYE
uniref:Uncharacterized protein n=1 Tax=Anguilla anguilla TaxID=7936 RepID=A0A0E9RQ88_ANGAN